ncbi:hypothetical protein QBC36DRAFT_349383 [Triangularia setosa]|uniref:Uncharacterized protein n=1 Tax=Triangularia setosa TaxID=2587417 RepID=A0AAN6W2U1_9PEZI|nr:hypothetical protein QBC36DRAFT_349383 [Podospora setosa]
MCDCVPAFASGWLCHGDINGSPSLTPPVFCISTSVSQTHIQPLTYTNCKMTSFDKAKETRPEPSTSRSGPGPTLKTPTFTTYPPSVFRNPFSFKTMGMSSRPGKLPAFLMITTFLCLITLGATTPLVAPEEHRPAEVPHIAPEHPTYHSAIAQPHHEPEVGGEHRPEQPAHHPSSPQPGHEFGEGDQRQSHAERRLEEQKHPEEHQPEEQHHPESPPEVHIRSPLLAGAYTPSTPCPPSLEGQWNCMLTSWQRCASGIWSAVMPTAMGTQCAPGGVVRELKTVNAPDYPPQPQPQGNTNGWGQGLPPRYNSGGKLGVSMGLAGVATMVAVMVGGAGLV